VASLKLIRSSRHQSLELTKEAQGNKWTKYLQEARHFDYLGARFAADSVTALSVAAVVADYWQRESMNEGNMLYQTKILAKFAADSECECEFMPLLTESFQPL
jgi:hypothetical protein